MQINRLFEIVYILIEQKQTTAKNLAQHFEVSQRTIYRDIEILSGAGIPIYSNKGKNGGISILPNFVLSKTILNDTEKADILSSLQAIDTITQNKTNTAINKLSSLFGSANTDWIEVDFSSWANADEEKILFSELKSSILSKQKVSFTYSNSKGENTDRTAEPLKLCFKGNAWYLYAFCETKNDFRFFKLSRIKNYIILNELFNRNSPAHIFSENIDYKDEFVPLKLKLSPKMAYRVYDEFKDYELLSDGYFLAEISYPKGEWLFNYVSSFGEECEILEPIEIRQEYVKQIKKTLNKYL